MTTYWPPLAEHLDTIEAEVRAIQETSVHRANALIWISELRTRLLSEQPSESPSRNAHGSPIIDDTVLACSCGAKYHVSLFQVALGRVARRGYYLGSLTPERAIADAVACGSESERQAPSTTGPLSPAGLSSADRQVLEDYLRSMRA